MLLYCGMPVMSEQDHLSAVISSCTVVLGHGDHVSTRSPWRGPNARYQGLASNSADIADSADSAIEDRCVSKFRCSGGRYVSLSRTVIAALRLILRYGVSVRQFSERQGRSLPKSLTLAARGFPLILRIVMAPITCGLACPKIDHNQDYSGRIHIGSVRRTRLPQNSSMPTQRPKGVEVYVCKKMQGTKQNGRGNIGVYRFDEKFRLFAP